MKSENALIGDIILTNGQRVNNVRLYKTSFVNKVYSPDLKKVIATNSEKDVHAVNIRKFNFKNSQEKNNISKLKFYYLYRQYLKTLVETSDFYLADIAVTIDHNKSWQYTEFVPEFKICHTTIGYSKFNYDILKSDALVQKNGEDKYICVNEFDNEILTSDPQNNAQHHFLINIRPFNYDNIRQYPTESYSKVYSAYYSYKSRKIRR